MFMWPVGPLLLLLQGSPVIPSCLLCCSKFPGKSSQEKITYPCQNRFPELPFLQIQDDILDGLALSRFQRRELA